MRTSNMQEPPVGPIHSNSQVAGAQMTQHGQVSSNTCRHVLIWGPEARQQTNELPENRATPRAALVPGQNTHQEQTPHLGSPQSWTSLTFTDEACLSWCSWSAALVLVGHPKEGIRVSNPQRKDGQRPAGPAPSRRPQNSEDQGRTSDDKPRGRTRASYSF